MDNFPTQGDTMPIPDSGGGFDDRRAVGGCCRGSTELLRQQRRPQHARVVAQCSRHNWHGTRRFVNDVAPGNPRHPLHVARAQVFGHATAERDNRVGPGR